LRREEVLTGSSNYEDGLARGGAVKLYHATAKAVEDVMGGQPSSTGPLALADVDGHGNLDLFVGGRVIAGRYPEPADSLLLRNQDGKFVVRQKFEKIGLVSGAVFSDINGDGQPDLILSCEWGPIRILVNDHGHFSPWNPPVTLPSSQPADRANHNPEPSTRVTLNELTGWWAGVTVGDFDGDGRLDIVASNWGLNSRYRASRQRPRKIYFGDLLGRGILDLIEAYYDPDLQKEVPDRGLKAVSAALPFLSEKWTTFEAYGRASVQDIFGERLASMASLEANTLQSMVFLNRGDHFEAVPLPMEAQFSPSFGVAVADFDGDGNEDVLLAQNLFAVNPDMARCDAGRGLLLRGDGQGHFVAVKGQESGIKVYGEQRGCAVCDYDEDGRVDVAISQNGNATVLYHNVGARPGLRLRLHGPPGNPTGIGAKLRLIANGHKGPVREVHAGSGYWSQDSAVQVMNLPTPAKQIEVQWPHAEPVISAIPEGAREVEVLPSGQVRKLQ
jgi:hypothetical protein